AAVVIGLDTNGTVGYQVFTLVLALVLLSAASSLVFRGRFTARRILPRFASVGVPVTYRMAITNHTRRRQDGLVLLEELTDPRPTFEEFVTAREPGEERRNWFDRQVGYPRWAWLVSQKRGAVIAPRPLPTLPAAGETEVTLEVTPLRRGHLRFQGITIARPDPLGLVQALQSIALPQSLLVLPKRSRSRRRWRSRCKRRSRCSISCSSGRRRTASPPAATSPTPSSSWKCWPASRRAVTSRFARSITR